MTTKLLGIPTEPKNYNNDNVKLTYEQYRNIAMQIICKMLKRNKKLLSQILASEEIISGCIYAVMWADWTFNNNKSSLTTYRYNAVRWTIFHRLCYINKKPPTRQIISIHNSDVQDYLLNIEDNKQPKADLTIFNIIKDYLSDEQYNVLCLKFIDGLSLKEIARQKGVPRNRIVSIYTGALNKIKNNPFILRKMHEFRA